MLGDVVVQLESHAPALGFLRLHHAVGQPRSSSPVRWASVMSVTTMPKTALWEPFFGSARMEICTGSCEPSRALSSTWVLEPDLSGCFRSDRSAIQSSLERNRRNEPPSTCSSGHLTILAKHWLA